MFSQIHYSKDIYSLNSLRSRLKLFATIFNITDREPIEGLQNTLTSNIPCLRQAVPITEFSTILNENDDDVDVDMVVSEDNGDSDVVHEDAGSVRKAGRKRAKGGKKERKGPYSGSKGPKRGGGGRKDDGSGGATGDGGGRSGGGDGGGRSGTQSSAKRNSGRSGGVSTRSQARGNTCAVQDILVRAGYIIVVRSSYHCVVAGYRPSQMDTGKDIISVTKNYRSFIAKVVRRRNEKKFYNMQIAHPNIMKPEEVISTYEWNLVVLPKLVSLNFALDPHSSPTSKLQRMSYDLANGLHFLHHSGIAHLDIKPDNLVYHPKTFVLQIIDFNTAVWVKNADEKISGYRGTLAWTAPGWYILCVSHIINTNLVL